MREHATMEEKFFVRSVFSLYVYNEDYQFSCRLSQFRVAVVRIEKPVAVVGYSSGTQRK
jgi:hypothetical protein